MATLLDQHHLRKPYKENAVEIEQFECLLNYIIKDFDNACEERSFEQFHEIQEKLKDLKQTIETSAIFISINKYLFRIRVEGIQKNQMNNFNTLACSDDDLVTNVESEDLDAKLSCTTKKKNGVKTLFEIWEKQKHLSENDIDQKHIKKNGKLMNSFETQNDRELTKVSEVLAVNILNDKIDYKSVWDSETPLTIN